MKMNITNTYIIYTLLLILICIALYLITKYFRKTLTNNKVQKDNLNNTQSYVLYIPKREKYIKNVMNKIDIDAKYI